MGVCLLMGNFEYNSMEDLVFSRSFRNWVLDRTATEAGFWENWVSRHPEKREMVNHAKAVIYALQNNLQRLSEEEIDTEVQKALQRMQEAPRVLDEAPWPERRRSFGFSRRLPGATPFRGRYVRSFEWAAVLIGVCLVCYLFFRVGTPAHRDALHSFLASHRADPPRIQSTDTFGGNHPMTLPDSSTAVLAKGSKLYYSPHSTPGSRREVYLEGEAFFEIKKDPSRPFYVYTGNIVTKVLGTSFRIRAWSSDLRTTVAVRTGKVSVYREEDFNARISGGNESGGIVLTPNQEIVYDRQDHRLSKTLSDNPQRLVDAGSRAEDTSMVFKGTSVSRVFHRLEDVYGIPILFDQEAVSSCTFFATLGNESFYEKLNMLCKAINATYEVIDGNIVVTAPGCKN